MIYFFGRAIMKKEISNWRRTGVRANHLLAVETNTNAVNTMSTGANGGTRGREGGKNIPASSSLSSLALESSDSLLPPLGSHDSRFDDGEEIKSMEMKNEGRKRAGGIQSYIEIMVSGAKNLCGSQGLP